MGGGQAGAAAPLGAAWRVTRGAPAALPPVPASPSANALQAGPDEPWQVTGETGLCPDLEGAKTVHSRQARGTGLKDQQASASGLPESKGGRLHPAINN